MEIFVKVIAEDLASGDCKIAATSLLTFVALDKEKKPMTVPRVIPETEEEKYLHETAPQRAEIRKMRKRQSKDLANVLTNNYPWHDPAEVRV